MAAHRGFARAGGVCLTNIVAANSQLHMCHEIALDFMKHFFLSPLHPACAGLRSIVEPVQM